MWCQAGNAPAEFWKQTPRSTVLALQGAALRMTGNIKGWITAGYLTAMLGHCDPEKVPSLQEILGEADPAPETPEIEEQEDPRDNVRAWMAALGGAQTVKPEMENDSA